MIKWKMAKIMRLAIITGMVLLSLIFVLAVGLFWVGFHNVDSVYNCQACHNCSGKMINTGEILPMDEVYHLGLNQMVYSSSILGVLTFLLLIDLALFLGAKWQQEKI